MIAEEEIILIKGKRSKRPRPPSPLALTMPAGSSTTASGGTGDGSGGGASSDELTRGRDEEERDMANCLMLLAKGQTQRPPQPPPAVVAAANATAELNYQCKTCNKSFSSFRALGGHRASHSKPPIIKPTIGNNKHESFLSSSHGESTILSLGQDKITIRVHECSTCGAGFASGQALGGHMRRHRPLPAVSSHGESPDQAKRLRTVLSLDLNLPAPEDNNHDHQRENKFTFAVPQQEVIVFSAAPSLVDCQY